MKAISIHDWNQFARNAVDLQNPVNMLTLGMHSHAGAWEREKSTVIPIQMVTNAIR